MQRPTHNSHHEPGNLRADPNRGMQRLGDEIAALIQANLAGRDDVQSCVSELFAAIAQGLAKPALADANVEVHDLSLELQLGPERAFHAPGHDYEHAFGPNNPRTSRIVSLAEDSLNGRALLGFDIEGSGFAGRTGDRVALCPRNDPDDVRRILRAFRARGSETVPYRFGSGPAWRVLLEDVDIYGIAEPFRNYLVANSLSSDRASLVDDFVRSTRPSLLALLRRFPGIARNLADVTSHLAPLVPSAGYLMRAADAQDAELSVLAEQGRSAITTGQIRLALGAWVPIYILAEPQDHLADDGQMPLVLIGDDVGCLLIRGYLDERRRLGHRGRTWVVVVSMSDQPLRHAQQFKQASIESTLTRLDFVDLDSVNGPGVVDGSEEMLWRWFVDRSEIRVVARDEGSARRMQAVVSRTLAEGAKKPYSFVESAVAERKAQGLFRIQVLK